MAKARYRVTDEKIELVLRLRRTKSQRQIAEMVELSQGTVSRLLNARLIRKQARKKAVAKSPFFSWDRFSNNSIIL